MPGRYHPPPKHGVKPIDEPLILVFHFCNKDGALAVKNMQWIAELDPHIPFEVMLACDQATRDEFRNPIREIALKTFKGVRFFAYPTPATTSWPQAPNEAWQSLARYFGDFGRLLGHKAWLWQEADAIPVRSGWLRILCDEYVQSKKPFMGHVVDGMGHFNGVAIYPWNVSHYSENVMMIRNAAWDSFLGQEMVKGGTRDRFVHNSWKNIQHVWSINDDGNPTNDSTKPQVSFNSLEDLWRWCDLEACLFHRNKDGSLITWLRKTITMKHHPEIWNVPQHTKISVVETPKLVTVNTESAPQQPGPQKYKGKADILIVTFGRPTFREASKLVVSDAEWLLWCLRAMQKHLTGYQTIRVVIPRKDKDIVSKVTMDFDVELRLFNEAAGKGMLSHMYEICRADEWCKGADIVVHFDPDCIFHTPTNMDEYVVDRKPVMLKRSYTGLFNPESKAVSDCIQWKKVVEATLGFETDTYTMCRHPSCHPVGVYSAFREHVAKLHNKPFKQYVLEQRNEFPQTFAEFPALGAFAWEKFRDAYHWIDIDKEPPPKDRQKTYWSHGGITPAVKTEMEGFLQCSGLS